MSRRKAIYRGLLFGLGLVLIAAAFGVYEFMERYI